MHFPDQAELTLILEERKKLEGTLQAFRTGQLNCLASTQVLEEGMDIRTCNVVIRFDPIPEFRSYVQSKGRARAKPSMFMVMVGAGAIKERAALETYKNIEENAIDLCHRGSVGGDEEEGMDPSEVEEYLVRPEDKANSPRVTSLSAINLLNKYVQVRNHLSPPPFASFSFFKKLNSSSAVSAH